MMIHTCLRKRTLYIVVILSLLLSVPSRAADFASRVRLTVFPFLDAESRSLQLTITSAVERELQTHDFIEVVPLEREYMDSYSIEPLSLWTGVEGSDKQGGIFWHIRHQVIEETGVSGKAEYAVFGSIIQSGSVMKMNIALAKTGEILSGERTPAFSAGAEGATYGELRKKVPDLTVSLTKWLKGKYIVKSAEEDVRRYLGHIVSYPDTVDRIERYVRAYPRSLPLRALLLDLYSRGAEAYQQRVLEQALAVIDLYQSPEKSDTRYLLSLNLDPFALAAEAYEERKEWEKAITLREKALLLFPFKNTDHNEGLARDHYLRGRFFEEDGRIAEAREEYVRAGGYVSASSEYRQKIHDGIGRTKQQ